MLEETINQQYDIELEKGVLGAIMLEKDAFMEISSDFKPELFFSSENAIVARAIIQLNRDRGDIDILTVTQKVKEMGEAKTVNAYYISQLTSRVASSANIQYHIKLIQQMYMLRECRKQGETISKETLKFDADPFKIISEACKNLDDIIAGEINKSIDTIQTLSDIFLNDLELKRNSDVPPGLSYGLTAIDATMGGSVNSDFIIIAARPGMGKTAFIIKKVRKVAIELKKPIAIFSLEMSSLQLMQRIVSGECRVNSESLRTGKVSDLEMNNISKRVSEISRCPIYIDDTGGLEINDLKNRARRLKMLYGIEEIIIDYLQLMKANLKNKNSNREQEISCISRELKSLAKELNIPVIALSQLSRAVEQRPNKMPLLSDLRESGSLEQDADVVMFIFRPEYYGIDSLELNGMEVSSSRKAIIDIAKNRHGAVCPEVVGFAGQFTEFYNLEDNF